MPTGETLAVQPLHGDLAQAMREQTLAGFKAGKFFVLIATDVAARGLDVNAVELVLMVDPPSDWESYIHRWGGEGSTGHDMAWHVEFISNISGS